MKKLKRIIIVSVILTISPSYGFSMHDNHGDGHHHMKNEEMKKMEELDDGDQYLNSVWADPKQLKNQLQGTSNIQMKF